MRERDWSESRIFGENCFRQEDERRIYSVQTIDIIHIIEDFISGLSLCRSF